ncbi:uncharacterized [Tachysurus ichikawai]
MNLFSKVSANWLPGVRPSLQQPRLSACPELIKNTLAILLVCLIPGEYLEPDNGHLRFVQSLVCRDVLGVMSRLTRAVTFICNAPTVGPGNLADKCTIRFACFSNSIKRGVCCDVCLATGGAQK